MADTKEEEKTETSADESTETPEKQQKEEASGSEAIKIPEDFQKAVYSMMGQCSTKSRCDYVRNCVNEKDDELMKADMKKKSNKKDGSSTPTEFSTGDMPKY